MTEVVLEYDARGLKCPLPVLKAHKILTGLPPGGRLRLIADDQAALVDVPFYCREQNHRLLDTRSDINGVLSFLIARWSEEEA